MLLEQLSGCIHSLVMQLLSSEAEQGQSGHIGLAAALDTVFHHLFSSKTPTPLLKLWGGKRRRLPTLAPAAAEALFSSEQKAEPKGTASMGTSLSSQLEQKWKDLAISFHSGSSASFTQISSSSENKSWGMCCSYCLVLRMNCTHWDGVSGDRRQSCILLLWLSCSRAKWASDGHQFSHKYWAGPLPLGLCRLDQSHRG